MRNSKITTRCSLTGNFWRMVGPNGKIVADGSEGYKTKAGLRRALLRLKANAADIPRMVDEALIKLDAK